MFLKTRLIVIDLLAKGPADDAPIFVWVGFTVSRVSLRAIRLRPNLTHTGMSAWIARAVLENPFGCNMVISWGMCLFS